MMGLTFRRSPGISKAMASDINIIMVMVVGLGPALRSKWKLEGDE
jgi:hypothetical protein